MSRRIESSPELSNVIHLLVLGRLNPVERAALERFDNLCQVLERKGLYPQDNGKEQKLLENLFRLIPHAETALARHHELVDFLTKSV